MQSIITLVFLLLSTNVAFAQKNTDAHNLQQNTGGWVRPIGGDKYDLCNKIIVDHSGNIYCTGYFEGQAVIGDTIITSSGDNSAFLAKLAPDGHTLWVKTTKYFASGTGLAVDKSDNIYMIGNCSSLIAIDDSVVVGDMFIAKFTSSGVLQWIEGIQGEDNNPFQQIAIDSNNIIYTLSVLSGNIALTKYDTNRKVDWTRQVGIAANGLRHFSLAIGLSGSIYTISDISDSFTLSNIFLYPQAKDILIVKVSPIGEIRWAVLEGESSYDHGHDVVVDFNENIYAVGNLAAKDLIIVKLDSNGSFKWRKRVPNAPGWGVATNGTGVVGVTGALKDTANFDHVRLISCTPSVPNSGMYDIFVAQYDSNGNVNFAYRAGSPQSDDGLSIAMDGNNNLYVTGGLSSGKADFLGDTLTNRDYMNAFIWKVATYAKVSMQQQARKIIHRILPNPANKFITIQVNIEESSYLDIRITDILGRHIINTEKVYLDFGMREVKVDISRLSPGNYHIIVTTVGGRDVAGLMVVPSN